MRIEAGTYNAVTTGMAVQEAKSGAVMCVFGISVGGTKLRGVINLVKKDGTANERGQRDVAKILGWEVFDWNQTGAEPATFAGHEVQVLVEDVIWTNPEGQDIEVSNIKYVNPPGGGGNVVLEKGNAKALAAKYGAATRALFGTPTSGAGAAARTPAGKLAASVPPATGTAPMAKATTGPKAPPAAAKHVTPLTTRDECWEALGEEYAKADPPLSQEELAAKWTKVIGEATGKPDDDTITSADWGTVMDTIRVPF
jgi:hypothetical protein